MDLKLTPPSKNEPEGEFISSPIEVPIGHKFSYKGSKWIVTWCQPNEPRGWLLMIVPDPKQGKKGKASI